jgi:hypothetical protein
MELLEVHGSAIGTATTSLQKQHIAVRVSTPDHSLLNSLSLTTRAWGSPELLI